MWKGSRIATSRCLLLFSMSWSSSKSNSTSNSGRNDILFNYLVTTYLITLHSKEFISYRTAGQLQLIERDYIISIILNKSAEKQTMGNTTEQQVGYPIDYNVIALLVTGQTERVIEKMEADPTHSFLKDSINFRNDNLLHYACAKNNLRLVEYILMKNPRLSSLRNNLQ